MIINRIFTISLLFVLTLSTACTSSHSVDPFKEQRELRQKLKQAAIESAQKTTVVMEELADKNHPAFSDIELLWDKPDFEITGVIIKYGFEKNNLDNYLKIPLSEIKIIQDHKHGEVMHYIIKDIPLNETLYATITGYTDSEIFDESEIVTIK